MSVLGKTVLYKLGQTDAEQINKRRYDAAEHREQIRLDASGYQAHAGNAAQEGQTYAAVVVHDNGGSANLQVLLDGNDVYWATSRVVGDGNGQYQTLVEGA